MKNIPKRLVIIAGANGTGKTTLAKEFLKKYKIEFINADEIAAAYTSKGGQLKRIKAGKKFISVLQEVIRNRRSAAIESTLSGKYLLKIIRQVKKYDYYISIIYFFVDDPEIALARIKVRVQAGGHDVPKEDVIRRFYRSKVNFWNLYKGLADDWTIFYNGFEKAIPVATGEKTKYTTLDETLFSLYKRNKR
ncbi:MAG: AAA family ATPase [bacterium]